MEGRLSKAARNLKPSPIQELSYLAQRSHVINLAEGFPDFPAPEELKQSAVDAINSDHNQYTLLLTLYMYDENARGLIAIADYGQEYGRKLNQVFYHGYGHYDSLQIHYTDITELKSEWLVEIAPHYYQLKDVEDRIREKSKDTVLDPAYLEECASQEPNTALIPMM